MLVSVAFGAWSNYLAGQVSPDGFTFKAQSLGILVPLAGFPVALVLWFLYQGHRARDPWIITFFVLLFLAWPIHVLIARSHGDQFAHTVWLYLPILAMIAFKLPSPHEAWVVIRIFAWLASGILVITFLLEFAGAITVFALSPEIIEWEKTQYWIPLSGFMHVDGRWPGPFGYNSKTGFIGALIVLIAITRWNKWSGLLLGIGVMALLLTAARSSLLACVAGLAVLAIFARSGPTSRIPIKFRLTGAVIGVVAVALLFLFSPTATTGRFGEGGIWQGFLNLWATSPWIGVGQVGILADPIAGISMEAHNQFIQELTRFGLIGLITQYSAFVVALSLAAVSALRRASLPLAIFVAFGVASLSEVFIDAWLLHSTYSLILILATLMCQPTPQGQKQNS